MEQYKQKIFRILVITGLFIILVQIYLLPSQKPYMDLVLLEPREMDWQIAPSVKVEQNQSIIYPYIRNVMNKIVMIQLRVYGLNEPPVDDKLIGNESQLKTNTSSTWIVKPEKPAKNLDFHSNWEIKPWKVSNISSSMEFLVVVFLLYQNHDWNIYNWVSLVIL